MARMRGVGYLGREGKNTANSREETSMHDG